MEAWSAVMEDALKNNGNGQEYWGKGNGQINTGYIVFQALFRGLETFSAFDCKKEFPLDTNQKDLASNFDSVTSANVCLGWQYSVSYQENKRVRSNWAESTKRCSMLYIKLPYIL